MAIVVVMPKLGMTMVEGTLATWLVPDGSLVEQGTPIFRMTTEKIDYEVEADAPGVLRHAAAEEAVIEAGGLVGYILAPGEAPPADVASLAVVPVDAAVLAGSRAGAAENGDFVRATPAARRLARELNVSLGVVSGTGLEGRVGETDVRAFVVARGAAAGSAATARPAEATADEIKASPLARRLAAQHGIDLRTVPGTGPGGRIVQEDIEQAVARAVATPSPASVAAIPAVLPPPSPPAATVPYKGMRRTIGERMHASLQQMAQLTMTTEADVTDLVKLRGQLVEEWQGEGIRVGYTDLVIKSAAKALRDHPRVNAALEGESIVLHDAIHIGMAVALPEGLIVPVLRDADRKSIKQLAAESAQLAERARQSKLGLDDVSGGTFSVTALGMYGVDAFTPIVNPPQAAILGVGRIRDGIALTGSEVSRRSTLTLSLTIDHRVLDGAPAAEFLGRVRQLLERPYLLLAEG